MTANLLTIIVILVFSIVIILILVILILTTFVYVYIYMYVYIYIWTDGNPGPRRELNWSLQVRVTQAFGPSTKPPTYPETRIASTPQLHASPEGPRN